MDPRPDRAREVPAESDAASMLRDSISIPRSSIGFAGAAPGIELDQLETGTRAPFHLVCFDYSADRCQTREFSDEAEVEAFLVTQRPEWCAVRWIDVRGIANTGVIRGLAEKYGLHPLAVEDVLTPQRVKVDDYPAAGTHPGRLFVSAETLRRVDGRLEAAQLSLFLGHHTVLSFQPEGADLFAPVVHRLETSGSRVRREDASFLAYSLIDCAVDRLFPVLEEISRDLEAVEEEILDDPNEDLLKQVYRVKRDLMALRRVVVPTRELVRSLQKDPHECLSEVTQTYMRDVYDQAMRSSEFVEIYRDVASELIATYMTTVSNRLNDVMKVLTIFATIFVPLTFLAGVYGMNMPIPENHFWWSYPAFWLVSVVVAGAMLLWFRRLRWL